MSTLVVAEKEDPRPKNTDRVEGRRRATVPCRKHGRIRRVVIIVVFTE
jgi:hypothetical protein